MVCVARLPVHQPKPVANTNLADVSTGYVPSIIACGTDAAVPLARERLRTGILRIQTFQFAVSGCRQVVAVVMVDKKLASTALSEGSRPLEIPLQKGTIEIVERSNCPLFSEQNGKISFKIENNRKHKNLLHSKRMRRNGHICPLIEQ